MIDVVLVALMTVFATYIVVESTIAEPVRDQITAKLPGKFLDVLVNCYFCTGTWLSLAATGLLDTRHDLSLGFVETWLAGAGLAFVTFKVAFAKPED